MNSIMAIHPCKHHGLWVFDDPATGLVQEPLIAGADVIIERLAAGIPNADAGFTLVFSTNPFPGYQAEFVWQRADVAAIGITTRRWVWKAGSALRCGSTSIRPRVSMPSFGLGLPRRSSSAPM